MVIVWPVHSGQTLIIVTTISTTINRLIISSVVKSAAINNANAVPSGSEWKDTLVVGTSAPTTIEVIITVLPPRMATELLAGCEHVCVSFAAKTGYGSLTNSLTCCGRRCCCCWCCCCTTDFHIMITGRGEGEEAAMSTSADVVVVASEKPILSGKLARRRSISLHAQLCACVYSNALARLYHR